MRFSDIPGHDSVKSALRSVVESGHIPHAVMLSGPSGSGKMMLARAYAQYLQCEHPKGGEPCGHCQSCRLHAELSHPDLHFIYPIVKNKSLHRSISADVAPLWEKLLAESPAMCEERWLEILDAGNSQTSIYVEEANEIVRLDSFPPYSSKYKIFIIWQPERFRPETANKLLKVIEEPSEGTMFIMVTNNELMLLPTIFSRVQRFQVGRLSDADIERYLVQNYNFPEYQAADYARLCAGSLIRADELGQNSGENEEFLSVYQEVMRAAYSKKVIRLRLIADKISSFGREKLRRLLDYMSRMIRENFMYNLRMPQLVTMTPDEENFSVKFSPFINHANVEDFLTETDRARRDIERNANSKLVLFDYFLYIIIFLHRKPQN